ncbi:MAG: cellulase family glycosylhydrolase [Microthrixaceae bacterium]
MSQCSFTPRVGRVLLCAATAVLICLTAVGTNQPAAGAQGTQAWDAFGQVSGTNGAEYLADSDGRALQFRGVNIKTTDPLNAAREEVLDAIAARGFNLIRLSIYWHQFEPENDSYDQDYLDDIGQVLTWAEERGIWVTLDFHQDVFGPAFGDAGIPEWATNDGGLPFEDTGSFLTNYLQPGVQEAWENLYEDPFIRAAQAEAWRHVAAEYVDHPNVLGYDLLNEPFGKMRPGEDLFSAAARVEREQLTPMYQRLTDAIRTVDERSWMFIEAPNLASLGIATSLGRVDDERVVFFPHMYNTDIETEIYNGDGDPSGYNPEFFANWAKAITTYTDKYPVPMMVGEWGVPTPYPTLDTFIAEALATLEDTTSGWTWFTGCFGGGYCTFDENGDDREQVEQIVQPYARAIAGLPEAHTFDPSTGTLRLAYVDGPSMGATELVVPADKVYPDGWRVDVDDQTVPMGPAALTEGGARTASVRTMANAEASGEEALPGLDIISVEVPQDGGTHTVCLKPADSEVDCDPPPDPSDPGDPSDPPSSLDDSPSSGDDPPSTGDGVPISGQGAAPLSPKFTG